MLLPWNEDRDSVPQETRSMETQKQCEELKKIPIK
jgi:hypothetical protein